MRIHIPHSFKITELSFKTHPLRLFLTILGIVIGIAAVIMVVGIGQSAQQLVLSQVEKVGSNLIGILPGASQEDGPPAQAFGVITTTLTNDDLTALRVKQNAPHLEALSGYVTGSATLKSRHEEFDVSYQGVSPEMQDVENITVASGRFFFPDEEDGGARVLVMGATRAKEFFPQGGAIGSQVKLGEVSFKVIGVLEARGATAFSSPDDLVYIPLGTAQRELLGIRYLNFARGKVDDPANIEVTIQNIDEVLRKRHDIEDDEDPDYSIRNTQAALGILTQITDVLRYFLLLIASVSLLVGGVGIMNSMLIAVSQRVWEIGLRKAVGANRFHILQQFLMESVLITTIGGFFGILIGIALTYLISLVVSSLGYEWNFIISLNSVLIGTLVSIGVGLVFGIYPALKASKVSPLEALRYE